MPSPQVLAVAPYATAVVLLIAVWRIYGRLRASIGRQPIRVIRTRIVSILFLVALVLLLLAAFRQPWSIAGQLLGVVLGVTLAQYGGRHTTFEELDGQFFYTPPRLLSPAMALLFIGYLLYKLLTYYEATEGFTQPRPDFQLHPVALFFAGVILGFYSWFSFLILRGHSKEVRRQRPASGA
jgi:hypothetical protein